MFCPICGKELIINKHRTLNTSWGVCPACGHYGFIVVASLQNYNLSVEQAIKKLEKGEPLPVDVDLHTLKSIDALQFLYKRMGTLGRWTKNQWELVGKQHDTENTQQVKLPNFLCLDSGLIHRMQPYMLSASAKAQNPDLVAGINIPLFQHENQCVGYCALFKPSEDNYSCFAWRTYLHRFYEKAPRAFLCYRPQIFQPNREILLVDNFTAYLQMTWLYDTGYRERTAVFPNKVVPVLLLGKKDIAIDYLMNYNWTTPRITLITPSQETVRMVKSALNKDTPLKCSKLRVASNAEELAEHIRKCKSSSRLENIIDDYFVEIDVK